jgi:hypothetical protein
MAERLDVKILGLWNSRLDPTILIRFDYVQAMQPQAMTAELPGLAHFSVGVL